MEGDWTVHGDPKRALDSRVGGGAADGKTQMNLQKELIWGFVLRLELRNGGLESLQKGIGFLRWTWRLMWGMDPKPKKFDMWLWVQAWGLIVNGRNT